MHNARKPVASVAARHSPTLLRQNGTGTLSAHTDRPRAQCGARPSTNNIAGALSGSKGLPHQPDRFFWRGCVHAAAAGLTAAEGLMESRAQALLTPQTQLKNKTIARFRPVALAEDQHITI